MIREGTDSVYFTQTEDGKIGVDPAYAAANPGWHALIYASSQALEIAAIAKTPFSAITLEQEAKWRTHILAKVASEYDGVAQLERVARWLQALADSWPKSEET